MGIEDDAKDFSGKVKEGLGQKISGAVDGLKDGLGKKRDS